MAVEANDNATQENDNQESEPRNTDSPTPSHDEHALVPSHEEKAPDSTPQVSKSTLWTVLIGLTLATFLVSMNASIVATAIPTITLYFHTIADVGWYGSAYLLANTAILPLTGKLYTYFSSKRTFISFLCVFEIGSLVCAVSKSSKVFIIGRAIGGAGQAGIVQGSIAILTTIAPLEQRPLLIGWILSMSSIGAVAGPLVGGAITQHIQWRWCFFINLPPGGATILLLLLLRIPDRISHDLSKKKILMEKMDFVGFVLFACSVVMLLLAVEWGGINYRWNDRTIIGLFVGSGSTFLVYLLIWARYKGTEALIPLSMFRNTQVACACVTGFFQMGGLLLLTYYLPIWFQVVKGASPTMSGVMNLPTMLSQIVFTLISGFTVNYFGYHTPWAVFGSSLTAIGAGLMSSFLPSSDSAKWIGYQVIAGAGRGSVLPMTVIAAQAALPDDQADVGSGFVTFSLFFGGSIFVALGETIFINQLGPALKQHAAVVPADVVIEIGATGVRKYFHGLLLQGVILAYNQALTHAFYLAAGGSAAATITSFGLGWKNLRKVKKPKKESSAA